jgi:hypothetical protein
MHFMKHIRKYKSAIKLPQVSAPSCHHQGDILTKEYKAGTLVYETKPS